MKTRFYFLSIIVSDDVYIVIITREKHYIGDLWLPRHLIIFFPDFYSIYFKRK